MKRILLQSSITLALVFFTGCSENIRTRHGGGNMTVNVPPGNKLVNATWKDSELWYLYQPMQSNEIPVTTIFKEKSVWGLSEGSVTFVESK